MFANNMSKIIALNLSVDFLYHIKQGLYLAKGITVTMVQLAVFLGAGHFQIRIGYLENKILSLWVFKHSSVYITR